MLLTYVNVSGNLSRAHGPPTIPRREYNLVDILSLDDISELISTEDRKTVLILNPMIVSNLISALHLLPPPVLIPKKILRVSFYQIIDEIVC
jgi:hypothetical protein